MNQKVQDQWENTVRPITVAPHQDSFNSRRDNSPAPRDHSTEAGRLWVNGM